MISATVTSDVQFYDLDPMQVVWHGNYARFLEQARCALLDRLGYNYDEMAASGYLWPIVDMQIKYVRPLRFKQVITVTATLVEYENRIRINYVIADAASGEISTRAKTDQVAVLLATGELQFQSPPTLIERVEAALCA